MSRVWDWGIVIVTAGRATWNASLWDWAKRHQEGRSLAVVIVTGSEREAVALRALCGTAPQCQVLALGPPFSYSRWATVGAALVTARHYCFLHDDVTLPEETGWLDQLRGALATSGVGLAVPLVPGAVGMGQNPAQALPSVLPPFWHTTDYISGACVAITRATYQAVNGWNLDITGYDWEAIDLQRRVAQRNLRTAVVPAVTIEHPGARTWGGGPAAERARRESRKQYMESNGLVADYASRPQEVRIALPEVTTTLAVIADSRQQFVKMRRQIAQCDELIVMDASDGRALWPSVRKFLGGRKRVCYAVPTERNIRHQVANLSSGKYLTIIDARSPTPDTKSGRRVRAGHHYTLLHDLDELHFGFLRWVGLGDMVMMTPTFAALRRAYPHLKIVAHARPNMGEILRHNPDIWRLDLTTKAEDLPINTAHFYYGVGSEGTIRHFPVSFGVEKLVLADRRFRFYLDAAEVRSVVQRLADHGCPESGVRVIGVQWHGAWFTKNWRHSRALVEQLLADPRNFVLTFSDSPLRRPNDMPAHPRLWQVGVDEPLMPIREVITLIAHCDALVGFDSGLSFSAMAVGCPTVALFGSHDPSLLVDDAGNDTARRMIRHVGPLDCLTLYGRHCRENGMCGEFCPFREGTKWPFGADCLDTIGIGEVRDALAGLPTWDGLPLRERVNDATIRAVNDYWRTARPGDLGLSVSAGAAIGPRAALRSLQP